MGNIIESGNARLLLVEDTPIWLNPRVRQDLRNNNPDVAIDLALLSKPEYLGKRDIRDTLPWNFDEVVRLRRNAREVSKELETYATEALHVNRYCTVVEGSVAKGLVRQADSDDPSDIDMDLIVDGIVVTPEQKCTIKQRMLGEATQRYGVKIDMNLQDNISIRKSKGFQARAHLWGNAYPIANVGNMWQETVLVARENERLLNYDKRVKNCILKILPLLASGDIEQANALLAVDKPWMNDVRVYFENQKLLSNDEVTCKKADMLFNMINR